jgi:malonate-semialdehyde dehydrogenase (acetylating)/methylmalonate-semialdehyde dehydrogenase
MIPLWSLAMAVATGNTLILKPSERDPGASAILVELLQQAGAPKGVVSVINGTIPPVQFICKEPRIKAITFVGGNKAGEYIYETGSKHGKRVQANLGAKNHAILMPDANENFALNSIVGGAFGAAGQRCPLDARHRWRVAELDRRPRRAHKGAQGRQRLRPGDRGVS